MEWYTGLGTSIHLPGIKTFLWDFGGPGHGKGVWDGIAGKLENVFFLRTHHFLIHGKWQE